LRNCRRLAILILDGTEISDAVISQLGSMPPPLVDLSLRATRTTDVAVRQLVRFQQLERLSLKETKVSDACLPDLVALKQLQTVDLRGTKVTDVGLQQLKRARPTLQVMY
jgi:hypothetical protein